MRRSLPHPRVLLVAAAILLALGGSFLLVRDSSFVEVRDVEVVGLTGPEAPQLRKLLTDAARDMTTLHVDEAALEAVTEPYPVVGDLVVETDFPHGMVISVRERTPVAAVQVGDRRTLVAGDGTLLPGAADRQVATVDLRTTPGGDRIADARARAAIAALAAAPAPLRGRVDRAAVGRGGLVLELSEGPELRFGDTARLNAKWAAAARVLADADAAGATYLDLRFPERPAAGGLEDPATQADPDADSRATAPTTTTPGATGGTASATPSPTPAVPGATAP